MTVLALQREKSCIQNTWMALQMRCGLPRAAADHSQWQRWRTQRCKTQHFHLAQDKNLKLSFNRANSPIARLGKCLVCRLVLCTVSRGLVVGLFSPASRHAAITTAAFAHPQVPAGRGARSF